MPVPQLPFGLEALLNGAEEDEVSLAMVVLKVAVRAWPVSDASNPQHRTERCGFAQDSRPSGGGSFALKEAEVAVDLIKAMYNRKAANASAADAAEFVAKEVRSLHRAAPRRPDAAEAPGPDAELLSGRCPAQVYVVAPHHRQRRAMAQQLDRAFRGTAADALRKRLVVDTVERMQGQEADVVFVLYAFDNPVRDNPPSPPAFQEACLPAAAPGCRAVRAPRLTRSRRAAGRTWSWLRLNSFTA